jgi:hypothetical protein
MTAVTRFHNTWLVGLFAVVCFSARICAGEEAQAGDLSSKYVLDLSGSPNHGVSVGRFNNLAFRLDSQRPSRKLSVPAGDQRMPELVATFDYADCTKGQESLLEKPLHDLAAGDPVWVDYVDVAIVPSSQRGLKWSGGVCYGFREPGGKWHWDLTTTPLTYDKGTDRFMARVPVRRGPIDALKLVFDYSVPPQSVSSVTVATRPMSSRPDPPFARPKQ